MRLARTALVLLLAIAASAATLRAQISPGPLARAHAKLQGPTNCVQCHGLKKEPMTQRCLACHKEVAWLQQRDRGVHASARLGSKRECAQCHPDHAGVDFALIDWGKGGHAAFEHQRAGWALEGKHATAKCVSCHTAAFRTSTAATLSPRTSGAGWMGLETACITCHERDDVHRTALGAHCDRCHDANYWRKATRFDHATSSYPLTNKHRDVACDKCHKAAKLGLVPEKDGHTIGRFKPLPFEECSACHADPHQGRLAGKCSTCHSTSGFRDVDRKEFDHSKTRYALAGKHATVRCESCHGASFSKKSLVFARCTDCHADAHYGRGTLKGAVADCAACHVVDGFAPSTYTVQQHANAAFALGGRHATVRCSVCHAASDSTTRGAERRVVRRVQLRPAFATCATCHADAHSGELATSASKGQCTACHDDRGWSPSSYSVAQHAALALPLDGAHARTACNRCHVAKRAAAAVPAGTRPPTATVSLRLAGAACETCHVDPHLGRYSAGSAQVPSDGCRACHDTRVFAPSTLTVSRHAAFGYALDGAHRAVPCHECHKDLGLTRATVTLRQAGAQVARLPFNTARRTACTACHADPHGGQFAARKAGAACETCHEVKQWSGAVRFVHDRDSSFPLAGAHQRVPCASCHKAAAQSGGEARVQYRSLPTACEGCHTDAILRKRP